MPLRNRCILSLLKSIDLDEVMQQPSVLLVEDDAFQRRAAEAYLMRHDLQVIAVENGAQMRRQIARAMPDLVLLDVQLPGHEDGFALARWLRESSTKVGIIMLTAADDSLDKVLGLESGADDYVAKPYDPRELLARCKSVLRRSAHKATPPLLERVRMGSYTLDLPRRQLLDSVGHEVALTAGEFDILKTFAENPNRPLSRDWLLETTSHRSRDPFDRAIDLRITRLRRKIEPTPDKPTVIRTVRGVGYMFVPPAE
jgi:DNA-binding response OmpR family regulator